MPSCIPSPPFPHFQRKELAEYSTFGIGGPARFFACAQNVQAMREMLLYAKAYQLPYFILGKGSNTLFDDRGFDGLVILNGIEGCEHHEGVFKVGSGYSFPRLGQISAKLGYHGLEFAAGIPATVGGAIFMNAGAGPQQTFDALHTVDYLTEEGALITFKKDQLQWGYRSTSFQHQKGAIVGACFVLSKQEEAQAHQRKLLSYRLETQPYKMKSLGCVFRNPQGGIAGKWIEELGLKGLRVGGVSVSTKHANFIVNDQEGSAQDVSELIQKIQERIYKEKGVFLEEEIRRIPYTGPEDVSS
ncbi:MAG: UDP-N-acetylmuramate dehydrogenase [Verrucomicrobia bacterium]|nr:UDP-N-acetylmuramate dehydrogenase [Verrucomicrobiota bacterium]MBS0647500.1 UDP-N-acetylmuramate dehydrogenase [Verrucomicrobiota bacterium]